MGFAAGVNAGVNIASSARKERQQQMTALQMNMEQGPNGMQYNEQGQTQKDVELEAVKAQLAAVQATVKQTESQTNADAISGFVDSWVDNDQHTALQQYKRVQAKLAEKPGIDTTDIEPLNFTDIRDTRELSRLGVDTELLKDPEVQNALSRSFIKITGQNGAKRIVPIDNVVKATNTRNMMDTKQRDRLTNNSRAINSILERKGITTAQQRNQELELDIKKQEMALTGDKLTSAQEFQTEITAARKNGASPAELIAIMDKYNPQQPSAVSASERAAEFKLTSSMKSEEIRKYVESKPTEWRNTLKSGTMDTDVGGLSLFEVAKSYQGTNKLSPARRDYLDGMVSTLSNTNRLRTKMANSDFNWNFLQKGMDEVRKLTGTDWKELSAKEQKNLLDRFSFDSDLKTVMAAYIKAMSGAAVSDEERKFYEGTILGGNWSTKEAALASMDGFMSGLQGGMNSITDGMISNLPADYLDFKARTNFSLNKDLPKTTTETKTTEKSFLDKAIDVVTKPFKSEPKKVEIPKGVTPEMIQAELRSRGVK